MKWHHNNTEKNVTTIYKKVSPRARREIEKNLCELCASVRNFHASLCPQVMGVSYRILPVYVILTLIFCLPPFPLFGQDMPSYSGITESIKDVTLSLPVSGRVSNIFFDEGDKVKKGQLLVSLDKKMEELEVNRRKLLWESKVEVDSASRKEKTLKSLLDATRRLFESTDSVSK